MSGPGCSVAALAAVLIAAFSAAAAPPAGPGGANHDSLGDHGSRENLADVQASGHPLRASGDVVYRWREGDADAYLLEGDCKLEHEGKRFSAESILLVVDGPHGRVRSRLVMDGVLMGDGRRRREPIAAMEYTTTEPEVSAPQYRGEPERQPRLAESLPADGRTASGVRQVSAIRQVQADQPSSTPPGRLPADLPTTFPDGGTTGGSLFVVGGGTRAVEILGRDSTAPPSIESINRPETGETVAIARGGVTVLVRDVAAQMPGGDVMRLGTVSLSADRVVGWFPLVRDLFSGDRDFAESEGELYLEGDIVFRQGERIVYADAMYYNVAREIGVVLDAEAITTIPEYQGVVRLKAEILRQLSRGNFVAFDAAVTSSRMGVPRYWLQSGQLQLSDRTRTTVDPETGSPVVDRDPFVTSENNFVYLGGVPVLYWPRLATSLEKPTFYLRGARVNNDDIFGTQVMLDWDLFQLLGREVAPEGLDVVLSTDYFSERGPAVGTHTEYNFPGLLGIPGPVTGMSDGWVIFDDGLDTLGGDRRDLPPEETRRGRTLWRHRHDLPAGYVFLAELGYVSDRNFLEQYLENEWDQDKDHETELRLRKYVRNHLFDLSARAQLNDFFTKTEQLPRLDHYALGTSWWADRLTWSAHNKVGYSRLNLAEPPINPAEAAKFTKLPGEVPAEGVEAATQQELSLPVQAGPVKVVPYVMGEAAHYGEAADGEPLTRLTGQTGLRASLPMWRVDPTIQSSLLNVRGLAHKAEWTAEYLYADTDTGLDELPLYDPLDDDAQEQFRRRFIFDTFGGTLPARFDPRTYAFRQGIQRWVTSPSDVIVDDTQQLRLGLNQRFQTKRGLRGRERIVDLFQLDVETTLFPEADRDNFGETIGPTSYLARYHVGDRVALLSDGYVDFFQDGLRSIQAGVRSSRPGVGDVFLGILSLEGPVSSTVLRSTVDYRLNEKWIVSAGTTYDFGDAGNVGQSLGLTRIGESFLLRVAANVDEGRDNLGIGFSFQPRFWPSPRLGMIGGELIPPPGVQGLE